MTIVMKFVSKSALKAKALDYFRQVEQSGEPLVITDRGRPVLEIVPFRGDPDEARHALAGSVLGYEKPTEPVAAEDWEALR